MNIQEQLLMLKPIAKGRPRARGRGKFIRMYTPKKTADAEKMIQDLWIAENGSQRWDFPIRLQVMFHFKIPKSYTKKKRQELEIGNFLHTVKPDLDNCVKLLCDSLNGIAFVDDAQICDQVISKRWANEDSIYVKISKAL
jgi:Holliday junction resolvase RusA-like endonuclease